MPLSGHWLEGTPSRADRADDVCCFSPPCSHGDHQHETAAEKDRYELSWSNKINGEETR